MAIFVVSFARIAELADLCANVCTYYIVHIKFIYQNISFVVDDGDFVLNIGKLRRA